MEDFLDPDWFSRLEDSLVLQLGNADRALQSFILYGRLFFSGRPKRIISTWKTELVDNPFYVEDNLEHFKHALTSREMVTNGLRTSAIRAVE